MSNLQVLRSMATSSTATASRVREEPNPARDAGTIVDMEVDGDDLPRNSEEGTTDEDGQVDG
jgi:hypothetical protein